ncbi:penicillin-binding protein 1C [Legionella hackeliae]|uniref:peptidoglycan glycosyltransferase n=1 Tax=Legionella hackeliae TaxID=449 RepID=A0A0A8UUE6_LEGHA|nr:penicillin-binding protein 1C [Legionella hackeliae]KTD11470.1 penicillin binding protein 1C, peptidoglycan biosynthesis [Legionella hackeliae]CEK10697.1 Penicillin binding protein 1C, peptidoglycan biosynthesis [Legionella hackeliae]STX47445.1 penicillin binding protein 1C, peptidoglycan biosynthesis [Legionella hackeliae]
MKRLLKILSITLVTLFVSGWALLFFSPKPPLLKGISFSTAVYDNQHHLLRLTLSHDDKYRLFTPLSQISPQLINTTLLQEDQYFYWHYGINPVAVLKAGWQTYFVKSRRLGASTITMQVARIRYQINSKKLSGKIWQVIRALQLEMHYSKREILEAYLNLAPYGGNIEGVGAASLIYFDKQASKLGLHEALTLSVIPQNPIKRTPRNENLKEIRYKLFSRWIKDHPEDRNKESTINLPLEMRSLHDMPFVAPHLVYSVLNDYSLKTQDIVTTLDIHLQTILSRITNHYVARKKYIGVYNASVLLIDTRDMGVRSLIGSVDFFNKDIGGQINGTDAKRSPGSTLKPFVYGLAFDQGLIHPNTVLKDVPRSFGSYNPENFDYDFMGPIKAKDALVLSRNIPAIYLASQLTNLSLHQFLEKAHISNLRPESYYGLALTLGGAEVSMQELTTLYAMLVNKGQWRRLRFRESQPVDRGEQLLSPEASFLVLDILKDTPRPDFHTFAKQSSGLSVSWKTGTSSGYRDAWTVGSFGPYVLAVWIGNFNNKGNPAFVGKTIAAPLFFELIEAIQQEKGSLPIIEQYPEHLHLVHVEVCRASGMLPTRYCQDKEMTWFIPGKSPIKSDTIYREVAIDKKTGLRTCHFDENTQFEVYEFWPSDLLKIFKQAGIQRRVPPAFAPDCSAIGNSGMSPQITSPQPELSYIVRIHSSQKTKVPFTAVTDADIRTIYWFVNETFVGKTTPDKPFLWTAKAGKYIVRVVDDHGLSDAKEVVIQVSG